MTAYDKRFTLMTFIFPYVTWKILLHTRRRVLMIFRWDFFSSVEDKFQCKRMMIGRKQPSISSIKKARVFCTNVCFGNFYYVNLIRKSCQNKCSYKKFVRLTLMKLTPAGTCQVLLLINHLSFSFLPRDDIFEKYYMGITSCLNPLCLKPKIILKFYF